MILLSMREHRGYTGLFGSGLGVRIANNKAYPGSSQQTLSPRACRVVKKGSYRANLQ